MPYIEPKLVEGGDLETRRRLVAAVTKTICGSLPDTPDNARIELMETRDDLFRVAGEPIRGAKVEQ
jgi:4-oxalocrotonate tautomerase